MITLRAFAYNAATVVCGVMLFFFGGGTLAMWSDERTGTVDKVVCVLGAVGFLVATVMLRRHRDRWLRHVAMYASFSAFEARVKESQGAILDVGGILFGQLPGSQVLDVVRLLKGAMETATLSQTYNALLEKRKSGEITDGDYRGAVDASSSPPAAAWVADGDQLGVNRRF